MVLVTWSPRGKLCDPCGSALLRSFLVLPHFHQRGGEIDPVVIKDMEDRFAQSKHDVFSPLDPLGMAGECWGFTPWWWDGLTNHGAVESMRWMSEDPR